MADNNTIVTVMATAGTAGCSDDASGTTTVVVTQKPDVTVTGDATETVSRQEQVADPTTHPLPSLVMPSDGKLATSHGSGSATGVGPCVVLNALCEEINAFASMTVFHAWCSPLCADL